MRDCTLECCKNARFVYKICVTIITTQKHEQKHEQKHSQHLPM